MCVCVLKIRKENFLKNSDRLKISSQKIAKYKNTELLDLETKLIVAKKKKSRK